MTVQPADFLSYRGATVTISDTPFHDNQPSEFIASVDLGQLTSLRGYIATWSIDEQNFFRLDSIIPSEGSPPISLQDVFPNDPNPIISKYCGELVFVNQEQRRFEPMGYNSRAVYETHLVIQNGKLVLREVYDQRNWQRVETEVTTYLEAFFHSDEAGFLRRMNENIIDQAPKLIYADWLEERHLETIAERVREYAKLWENSGLNQSRKIPNEHREYPTLELNYLWLRLLGFRYGV